jgi:hypothetical protein
MAIAFHLANERATTTYNACSRGKNRARGSTGRDLFIVAFVQNENGAAWVLPVPDAGKGWFLPFLMVTGRSPSVAS